MRMGTITVADHEVYEDIAVDDVVVISVLYADKANDDKGLAIVEKAEVVKGEIDSFEDMKNDLHGYGMAFYNPHRAVIVADKNLPRQDFRINF